MYTASRAKRAADALRRLDTPVRQEEKEEEFLCPEFVLAAAVCGIFSVSLLPADKWENMLWGFAYIAVMMLAAKCSVFEMMKYTGPVMWIPAAAAAGQIMAGRGRQDWLLAAAIVIKGVFCVSSIYIAVRICGISGVCKSMEEAGIPRGVTLRFSLLFRYAILFLDEVDRMGSAAALRTGGKRGITPKMWGGFAGHLLLRSMDRARCVYESMQLRGYREESFRRGSFSCAGRDKIFLAGWIGFFVCIHFM